MGRISLVTFALTHFDGTDVNLPSPQVREVSSITYVLHSVISFYHATVREIGAVDASDISAPCRFRDLGAVFYEIVNGQIRARRSLWFYDGVSVLDCTLLLATRVNRALGRKNFWICPRLSRSTRQTFSEIRTRRNDTSYEDICRSNRYHQFAVISNDFRLKCNFLVN